jgi:hypothetical protein
VLADARRALQELDALVAGANAATSASLAALAAHDRWARDGAELAAPDLLPPTADHGSGRGRVDARDSHR